MKFLIILMAIVAFVFAEFTDEENQKWEAFKLEYGKSYSSKSKEADRKRSFLANVANVEYHNQAFLNDEVTYNKAIHKYSDLTDAEFLARFGGIKEPAKTRTEDPSEVVTYRGTPPASLDLSIQFKWTVRNQLACGLGSAFATVAAIEYAHWKKTGQVVDAAAQQLVDCVYDTNTGCEGGWMADDMDYIAKSGGIASEQQYFSTGILGICKRLPILTKTVSLVNAQPYVQIANDVESIKTALAQNGALAIAVDATNWSSYKSGIFTSSNYANPSCTHAVALVGYGTDAATGIPYWIVRNSWGSSWWGEGGYIRLDARRCPTTEKPLGGIMLNYAFYPNLQ